jgi:hypothetical protein
MRSVDRQMHAGGRWKTSLLVALLIGLLVALAAKTARADPPHVFDMRIEVEQVFPTPLLGILWRGTSSAPEVADVEYSGGRVAIVGRTPGTAVIKFVPALPHGENDSPDDGEERRVEQAFVFVEVVAKNAPRRGLGMVRDYFTGRVIQLVVPKDGSRPYSFPKEDWRRVREIRDLASEIATATTAGKRSLSVYGHEEGVAVIEVDVQRRSDGRNETTWLLVRVVADGDDTGGVDFGGVSSEREVSVEAGHDVIDAVNVEWVELAGGARAADGEVFEVVDPSVAQVTPQLRYNGNVPFATGVDSVSIYGSKAGFRTDAILEYWAINDQKRRELRRLTIHITVTQKIGALLQGPQRQVARGPDAASLLAGIEAVRGGLTSGSFGGDVYVPESRGSGWRDGVHGWEDPFEVGHRPPIPGWPPRGGGGDSYHGDDDDDHHRPDRRRPPVDDGDVKEVYREPPVETAVPAPPVEIHDVRVRQHEPSLADPESDELFDE